MRTESALLRAYSSGTRAAPYESLVVADIGDVNVNLYDLKDTCKRITEAYRKVLAAGCIPLTMGERAPQGKTHACTCVMPFEGETYTRDNFLSALVCPLPLQTRRSSERIFEAAPPAP